MTEYIVDFSSIILEASTKKEAYEKAKKLVSNRDIEICSIEPN